MKQPSKSDLDARINRFINGIDRRMAKISHSSEERSHVSGKGKRRRIEVSSESYIALAVR
jgi:hypothetical protein